MTLCLNIRSLNKHENFVRLDALVQSLPIKPNVIGINETWLKSNDDGPHNNLSEYTFISNCRKSSNGGGVGLYIKII